MRKKLLITIILMWVGLTGLHSQPYSFVHYTTSDGLANNSTLCIAQDKRGFMWFGTGDSLSRFDGSGFKNYFPDTKGKISLDYIGYLVTDPDGTVWVGMKSGIFKYDINKDALIPFLDSIKNITSLFFAHDGNLWICSNEKIYAYSFYNHKLTRYIYDNKFQSISVAEMNNKIWIGTDKGILYGLDQNNGQYHSYDMFKNSAETSIRSITQLLPVCDSFIFVGTRSQGLKRFNIKSEHYQDLLNKSEDSDFINVREIIQRDKHEFWIATQSGIFIYNDSTHQNMHLSKTYTNSYYLSDNDCYSIFKDRENGIWIGTYYGGINYFNNQGTSRFTKFIPDNTVGSISGIAIGKMCGDSMGNIWIGTEDAGLNKLNPKNGKITAIEYGHGNFSTSYKNIQALAVAGNYLWVGNYFHGIDVLDIKNNTVHQRYTPGDLKKGLTSYVIRDIICTRNKRILLITNEELLEYIPQKDFFKKIYADTENHISLSRLLEGNNDTIWLGTIDSGMYSINLSDKKSLHHFSLESKSGGNNKAYSVTGIFKDRDDTLWMSTTKDGVCYLAPGQSTFKHLEMNEKFSLRLPLNIEEDDEKNLWIATNKGLIKLYPDRKNSITYTKNDGLISNELNFRSSYKDKNGDMYFGSTNGLIKFNPNQFHNINFAPPLYITDLKIEGEEITPLKNPQLLKKAVDATDTVILNYKQSSVEIGFSALTYASPLASKYQYMLEGSEEKWTILDTKRNAYYTNLPPGTYTFRVKAFQKGYFTSKERRLTIIIKPPLWASKWAYLLYLIIITSLLLLIIRYFRLKSIQKRERELFKSKMDFFTNIAHEIKTPLMLIKGPLENILEQPAAYPEITEDLEMMDKNSDRLIGIVNQLMDFRRIETANFQLNFAKINLTTLIKETYQYFKKLRTQENLHWELSMPTRNISLNTDIEALTKIINNLIHNAAKFAASITKIELLDKTDSFELIVYNDGILIPENEKPNLFKPFVRLQTTSYVPGTGIGLALSKNLADLLGYDLYCAESKNDMNIFVLNIPK